MKYLPIILFFLLSMPLSAGAIETPGITAYKEQNYGAAVRLLPRELPQFSPGSNEYFEHFLAYIESLLFNNEATLARFELQKLRTTLPKTFSNRSKLLEAQLSYIEKDFDNSRKILTSLVGNKTFSPHHRMNIAILLGDICLRTDRPADAVKVLSDALNDKEAVQEDEFTMQTLFMRALAATGKLDRIQAVYEQLKKKYPAQQDKLRHFELLVYAINQNLTKYEELFKKLFPDGKPAAEFFGDTILYQGALLAEQQSIKEKNVKRAAFHLKNQTWFAPNEEHRIAAHCNLVRMHMKNKDKANALKELDNIFRIYKNIPDLADWQILAADLQRDLKQGDLGLAIYQKIKENTKLPNEKRIHAARAASTIYKQLGQKEEMLKMYLFMAEYPGIPSVNDEGMMLMGKYYFENREYHMATSAMNKIQPSSMYYPEALFFLIQCNIRDAAYASALQNIAKLEKLAPKQKNIELPEFKLASVFFRGQIALLQKKELESAKFFEQAAGMKSSRVASQKILSHSCLQAAELYFKHRKYKNAGKLFRDFAAAFKKDPKAAASLYKSVYCYLLSEDYDQMAHSINDLVKSFPESEYTINALFHQVDHYRENRRLYMALDVLDRINIANNRFKKSEVSAQILYDKALIYYQLKQEENALACIESLKNYPEHRQLAEGIFLAGNIATDNGDNNLAATYFMQAASMCPNDLNFISICQGRAADNYFIAGSKNKNHDLLRRAADIYSKLVKTNELTPVFRLQSYYKLGRTLESLEDFQGAIDAYTEALYLSGIDGKENIVVPVWINKSARNAISIHLRRGGSNAVNDAVFIIRRLRKLNTMTEKELNELEHDIRTRTNN